MWNAATEGEVLYQYVHRELGRHTHVEVRKAVPHHVFPVPFDFGPVLFKEWIGHAVTSHVVARMVLFGRDLEFAEDPSELTRPLTTYAIERLGLTELHIDIHELVRLTLLACDACRKQEPTAAEREFVFQDWLSQHCYLCGQLYIADEAIADTAKYTLDHIWPLSLGGRTTAANLAPCCHECNRQKADIYSWPWGQIHRYFKRVETFTTQRDRKMHSIWLPNHLMELMVSASHNETTLKTAAGKVGPKTEVTLKDREDIAHFFNVSTVGVSV